MTDLAVTPLAMDPYGNPGGVIAGEVLDPVWGTAVSTTVVRRFPSTAARDNWTNPPRGALCVTTDTDTLWQALGSPVAWRALTAGTYVGHYDIPADGSLTTGTAILTIGSYAFAALANHIYAIQGLALMNVSAAGDIANVMIVDGATRLCSPGYSTQGTYDTVALAGTVKTGTAPRTITLQVQIQCSLGTARLKNNGPSFFDVYDLGHAPGAPGLADVEGLDANGNHDHPTLTDLLALDGVTP